MGFFGLVQNTTKRHLVEKLFGEERAFKRITYKRFDSQAFDTDLGYPVTTYLEKSVKAVKFRHNKDSAAIAESNVEVGDELFMVRAEDVPDGVSLKDQIVDKFGNVYKVKAIDDIFDIVVNFTVEGSSSIPEEE